MVDVVQEIVEHAGKRGYTFSPASLSGLRHDFPKIEGLSSLSTDQRTILFDLIFEQVELQIGPPPFMLHEDSIPNAAKAISKQVQTGGPPPQFGASAWGIIRDCCPYC